MQQRDKVNVVLFSGGRGSRVLSKQLINNPQVVLTLAVNGYDDGASTGEIRRLLGDSLGPSDFRKNASWLAGQLHCCTRGLIDLWVGTLSFALSFRTDASPRAKAALGGPLARDSRRD